MCAELTTRYPGAHPFPDENLGRKLFFGRERESIALANQIIAHRLVVLFAKSGLGKTSMLNAGIAEKLRGEGHIPLIVRVNDVERGPLTSVYGGVATACSRQGVEYVPGDKSSLWRFFKTAQFWLDDVLLIPALILDQFEELFTLQSEQQRNAFVEQLSYLVRGVKPPEAQSETAAARADPNISPPEIDDSPPALKIVLSLREDFLADLDELSDRIPGVLDERFRLVPLGRDAASRALQKPANIEDASLATQPFELEPQAVEEILNFLEQRATGSTRKTSHVIEPFQLQLICQRLETTVRKKQIESKDVRTRIALVEIGGARGLEDILKDFYHEQLEALPWREGRRVKRLCALHLISPQGRRLSLEETEIRRITKVHLETLKILTERRLLRSDQTDIGTYYELSHDSLVKPVLRTGWLYRLFRIGAFGIVAVLIGFLSVLIIVVFTFAVIYGIATDIVGKKTVESDTLGALFVLLIAIIVAVAWLWWSIRKTRYSWSGLRRLRI